MLTVGSPAPDFTLRYDAENAVTLSALKGQNVVLYFYPKDDTPGCTLEAKDFSEHSPRFKTLNTLIFGISKDSVASHVKFKGKYCLPFALLADPEGVACAAYGAWQEKSMFGKKYMGIARTTFLIDKQGIVRNIWPNVSVSGHVSEVLAAAEALPK